SKGGHSPFFDSTTLRAGLQPFNSDFRGLIFNDTNLGVRLFGNFASNRYQFNVALFEMLEKDAASGLNSFEMGDQRVFVANLYRQDTIKKGFTVEVSYHYNHDDPGTVSGPTLSRFTTPHEIKAHYIGFAADGHLGERLPWIFGKIGGGPNLSTAFYQAFGKDEFNSLA